MRALEFFFSSRRRHTRSDRDWSSDVCSSDLVMVDGRSVYSPTFSGVFWDTLDLPLSDIARIEVIRGPGGPFWGVNPLTGPNSLFPQKASETTGTTAEDGGGEFQHGVGKDHYGAKLGNEM